MLRRGSAEKNARRLAAWLAARLDHRPFGREKEIGASLGTWPPD
jgi:hypothetical protein